MTFAARNMVIALLLGISLSSLTFAEETAKDETEKPKSEQSNIEQPKSEQQDEAVRSAPEPPSKSGTEIFKPTEEISEDLSVPFPIDI